MIGIQPVAIAFGALDQFTVTFSESVDPATFTDQDVVLTKPGGQRVPVNPPQRLDGPTFRISFTPQTETGTYTIQIGTNITDFAANSMTALFQHGVELSGGSGEDADLDGLADAWERQYFGDLHYSGAEDPDGDKLSNFDEFRARTNPSLKTDADGDGMSDDWEVAHQLNPASSSDAAGDLDHDGLSNLAEFNAGTNPQQPDTDGDGFNDFAEVHCGSDPTDPASFCTESLGIFPAVELEYTTKAGTRYQIETSLNLEGWEPYGEPFTGDGGVMQWFVSARPGQKQFFRLKKL